MTSSAWSDAARILCVRLDTIGDVLMSTPAMRALKGARPGRAITLLTSSRGAEIAPLVPEVNEVIVYDPPWMKATEKRDSEPDHAMVTRLAQEGFDGCVIFTVYTQSSLPAALLCYLAGIPLRLAHCRENPYELLTDWVPEVEPERTIRHEVRRQLDLVAAIGCHITDESLLLEVDDDARRRVLTLLSEIGLDVEEPWAVLHPGASAPSRRYAPERFAVAARRLVCEAGVRVVLTGTQTEVELVEYVATQMGAPSVSLAGRLDMRELTALLSVAPLLISNNTGPVHIAAAVGTPIVDLYALTNPQHTPWGVPNAVLSHDVPCRWCYSSVCRERHHNCLAMVPPDQVFEAACRLLEETGRRYAGAPEGSPSFTG